MDNVEHSKDETRYFLDQDDSCHWYLIPISKKSEWFEWCANQDENWDSPAWATILDGPISCITFTDPKL